MAEIIETKRYRTSPEEAKKIQKERFDKLKEARDKKIKLYNKRIQTSAKSFKSATKAYSASSKLSSNLMKQFTGSANFQSAYSGGSQRVQAGPGRPAGVMKHRSPFTGKPIPAPQFYKEMRTFRRLQAQTADQAQMQQQKQFARQGVPPQQIQQAVQQRMQQQFIQQQMQRPQQFPQAQPQMQRQIPMQQVINSNQLQNGQVIPQGTRIWKFRRGVVGTEGGLAGPQQKVYGLPSSFWN